MSATLYCGDVRTVLAGLPEKSVQMVCTSPPYFGLRDYQVAGQLGLERSPEEYVAAMVEVFRGVRRVLRDDGVLWLNLGDSYAGARGGAQGENGQMADRSVAKQRCRQRDATREINGLKSKDLIGIPWLVAFALRADGWYLRSEIIWAKANCMPESVTDRPTKAHEQIFLLTKSERYYFDAPAIAEPIAEATASDRVDTGRFRPDRGFTGSPSAGGGRLGDGPTRNARSVWFMPTQPYAGAHFATFPEELARRCILAGSRPSDTVLDPFGGSGTVAAVACGHGRRAIHVDLNPAYIELARQRIGPILCTDAA